jgi:hypothetical protein
VISLTSTLRTPALDRLTAGARGRVSQAVKKTTFDLEAQWKRQIVALGAVDTGAYLNSVQGRMVDALTGEVASTVAHSVYVEYGTRWMAARPARARALAAAKPGFAQAVTEALRGE